MPYISKLAKRLAMSRRSLVMITALAACAGGDAATEPDKVVPGAPAIASIQMSPESTSVEIGSSMRLFAVPLDDAGRVLNGERVQWTSSDTAIATVDSTGAVQALDVGTVDIRAVIRGILGRTRVNTKKVPVASISVSPSLSSIQVGQKVTLAAVTSSSTGAVLTGRQVSWSSGSSTVASVNGSGVVTGLSAGRAMITASSEGRTNVATVDVTVPTSAKLVDLTVAPASVTLPIGEGQFFTVAARWDDNSTTVPSITWSAVGGGTVTSGGMYTPPQTPGVYRVIAAHTGGTVRDTATVTVAAATRTLTELTISPKSTNLAPGGVRQFAAAAKWSDGSTALPSLTWSSLDGGTVNASGSYTAPTAAGTYRVVVAGGTLRDTATVVVATTPSATVTSFVLSPGSVRVQRGGSVQFSTATTWSDGANRPVTVTYQVTGGTMTSGGLYKAGQIAGTFMVIATCSCGAAADTSGVVIETPQVVGVAISPKTTTLQPGASQAFAGTVTWSDNGTGTAPLTFSASGGGSINSTTGAYTAPTTAGTYRVILSVSGASVRDTATVTVQSTTPPPPSGSNSMYYNSAESICATSNANILFCDDFEDGDWYTKNADAASSSGGFLQTDGWEGTIYANPITPTGAAVCGSRGAKGTSCAATSGLLSGGAGGRNMAMHTFAGGPVTELWARWYYRVDPGYQWGAEKSMNFTKNNGDISWFNVQMNCGTGGKSGSATPFVQIIHGSNLCQAPNVSSISLVPDRWYFFEVHLKLNSSGTVADGLIEMWINDCGATGNCTGSPTLRTRMQNVRFDRNQTGCKTNPCQVEVLWLENWANPGSAGTAYYDQIVASKGGPIGFMP